MTDQDEFILFGPIWYLVTLILLKGMITSNCQMMDMWYILLLKVVFSTKVVFSFVNISDYLDIFMQIYKKQLVESNDCCEICFKISDFSMSMKRSHLVQIKSLFPYIYILIQGPEPLFSYIYIYIHLRSIKFCENLGSIVLDPSVTLKDLMFIIPRNYHVYRHVYMFHL